MAQVVAEAQQAQQQAAQQAQAQPQAQQQAQQKPKAPQAAQQQAQEPKQAQQQAQRAAQEPHKAQEPQQAAQPQAQEPKQAQPQAQQAAQLQDPQEKALVEAISAYVHWRVGDLAQKRQALAQERVSVVAAIAVLEANPATKLAAETLHRQLQSLDDQIRAADELLGGLEARIAEIVRTVRTMADPKGGARPIIRRAPVNGHTNGHVNGETRYPPRYRVWVDGNERGGIDAHSLSALAAHVGVRSEDLRQAFAAQNSGTALESFLSSNAQEQKKSVKVIAKDGRERVVTFAPIAK